MAHVCDAKCDEIISDYSQAGKLLLDQCIDQCRGTGNSMTEDLALRVKEFVDEANALRKQHKTRRDTILATKLLFVKGTINFQRVSKTVLQNAKTAQESTRSNITIPVAISEGEWNKFGEAVQTLRDEFPEGTYARQLLGNLEKTLEAKVGVRVTVAQLHLIVEELNASFVQCLSEKDFSSRLHSGDVERMKMSKHFSAESKTPIRGHRRRRGGVQWNIFDDVHQPIYRLSQTLLQASSILDKTNLQDAKRNFVSVQATSEIIAKVDESVGRLRELSQRQLNEWPLVQEQLLRWCSYRDSGYVTESSRVLLTSLRLNLEAMLDQWARQQEPPVEFKDRRLKMRCDDLLERKAIDFPTYCRWLRVLNFGNKAIHAEDYARSPVFALELTKTQADVKANELGLAPYEDPVVTPVSYHNLGLTPESQWGLYLLPPVLEDLFAMIYALLLPEMTPDATLPAPPLTRMSSCA
jgi:hypothetical protein